MSAKISAVINTFNEAANIADCIASIGAFADEILVCDMQSEDGTPDIARRHGARVVPVERMPGQFQELRRRAVSEARHEWVLLIDADERMTGRLKDAIRTALQDGTRQVLTLRILFWYFGGWVRHGIFYGERHPRVFRKDSFLAGPEPGARQVHRDWAALDGVTERFALPDDAYLLHLAYPSIETYVRKTVGLYADVEAEQMLREGVPFSRRRMLTEPVRLFVRSFIRQRGYRDGTRGLILSVLFASYRFTTWANLWLREEWNRGRPFLPGRRRTAGTRTPGA